MRVSDGVFSCGFSPTVTGWYHLTLVFHGPDQGQGLSVYHDGILIMNDVTKQSNNFVENLGTVVIGTARTDLAGFGSVTIDELTFWDRRLLAEEIAAIANMG